MISNLPSAAILCRFRMNVLPGVGTRIILLTAGSMGPWTSIGDSGTPLAPQNSLRSSLRIRAQMLRPETYQ